MSTGAYPSWLLTVLGVLGDGPETDAIDDWYLVDVVRDHASRHTALHAILIHA